MAWLISYTFHDHYLHPSGDVGKDKLAKHVTMMIQTHPALYFTELLKREQQVRAGGYSEDDRTFEVVDVINAMIEVPADVARAANDLLDSIGS